MRQTVPSRPLVVSSYISMIISSQYPVPLPPLSLKLLLHGSIVGRASLCQGFDDFHIVLVLQLPAMLLASSSLTVAHRHSIEESRC